MKTGSESVSVHLGCCNKSAIDWGIKQPTFISHSSRDFEVQDQDTRRLWVWGEPAPSFIAGHLLDLSSQGGGVRKLSEVSFLRAWISLMGAPPLRSHHLLKPCISWQHHIGNYSTWILGGHKHSVHSRVPGDNWGLSSGRVVIFHIVVKYTEHSHLAIRK